MGLKLKIKEVKMMHFNKKGTMKKVAVAALSLSMLVSGLTISTAKKDSVQAAEEYELKWSDEFNGNTLDGNNWNIEENGNGGGNNELQFYTKRSSNIEVSNGSLKIKALKENYGEKIILPDVSQHRTRKHLSMEKLKRE